MSLLTAVLVTRVTHGYGVSRKSGAPVQMAVVTHLMKGVAQVMAGCPRIGISLIRLWVMQREHLFQQR